MIPNGWENAVPVPMRRDSLWRMEVYRLARFVEDHAWPHVTRLSADRRTRSASDQLQRALASIGSNIAEGYSRGSGKDRVHFYEYALGSVREARHQYFGARRIIDETEASAAIELLDSIIRLLLVVVRQERSGIVGLAR